MMCMRRIAALFSILPLALGAVSVAAEEMQMDATIEAVNAENRSLTVKLEETGATQTFRVDEQTEISFERNLESGVAALRTGLADLRAGQEVKLTFDDEVMDGDWVIVHFIAVS